jgi:ABC-type branched-subunit amino acid transport system substrate-binding protein
MAQIIIVLRRHMLTIWQMAVKSRRDTLRPYILLIFAVLIIILSGCMVFRGEQVRKIALLAPFEGRYREIGYDALYAVRLAIADSGITNIDLLAIDDGGSIKSAIDRAYAIRQDAAIEIVIALGSFATAPEVQVAYGDTPVIIVGHWNAAPQ